VPDLLFPEIASILGKKCRRGEIGEQDVNDALSALESAEFLIQDTRSMLAETCRLSLAINHSVYDCFYLVAAAVLDTVLVTADEKLLRKLAASGLSEWSTVAVGLDEARDL
jgi:predicted nucleic acid-binding protein